MTPSRREPDDVSEAQWQTRLRAATRDLRNVRTMRAVMNQVERMTARREPSLLVSASGRTLADAARIVVFPGSFNPLTRAHIGLVERALAAGHDAALWLLAVASVDKERVERAALPDRMAQMRAYVRGSHANALALTNRGLYYEQARLLYRRFNPAKVSLLVGFDKVTQIFDARYYDDRDAALSALFADVRLLVAPRAGAGHAQLAALLERRENLRFANRVTYLDAPARYADDSSTRARMQAARGVDFAVLREAPPEAVALIETGAYAAEQRARGVKDHYAQRVEWLRGLAGATSDG